MRKQFVELVEFVGVGHQRGRDDELRELILERHVDGRYAGVRASGSGVAADRP